MHKNAAGDCVDLSCGREPDAPFMQALASAAALAALSIEAVERMRAPHRPGEEIVPSLIEEVRDMAWHLPPRFSEADVADVNSCLDRLGHNIYETLRRPDGAKYTLVALVQAISEIENAHPGLIDGAMKLTAPSFAAPCALEYVPA
ncbi:MAG: hypothetical protein KGI97_07065 [Alphaproteobacteria bacterium]|nr:hypothetical protein [Alphaproteobacteria bacterium]